MRVLSLILVSLMISGCGAKLDQEPRFPYGNIQIANLTGATIRNVQIQVGVGGYQLECASVSNNELCQKRFGPIPYPEQPIQLQWVDSDGSQQSKQLSPQISSNFPPGIVLQILININADGSVDADLKADS